MTPKQALDLFRSWSQEVVVIKHIDTFNAAYVALAKLVDEDAKKSAAPANG